MPAPKDPTAALRKLAASLPGAVEGTSCNQTSFRIGEDAFLFVGPGAKGQGFKAMFRLEKSLSQARDLASAEPDRFQAGAGHWVTVRFSGQAPLQKAIWDKWVRESHQLTASGGGKSKPGGSLAKTASSKANSKKTSAKKVKQVPQAKTATSKKKVSKGRPPRKRSN